MGCSGFLVASPPFSLDMWDGQEPWGLFTGLCGFLSFQMDYEGHVPVTRMKRDNCVQ